MMDKSLEYGFLMACWVLPFVLTDESNMPEWDGMTEEGFVEKEFIEGHKKRVARGINEATNKRRIELFEFAVKCNVI